MNMLRNERMQICEVNGATMPRRQPLLRDEADKNIPRSARFGLFLYWLTIILSVQHDTTQEVRLRSHR